MTYVTLNGYIIVGTTQRAVAIVKARTPNEDWTWLPRGLCQDGDTLARGDTDLTVRESIAEERGLDWS